MDYENITPPIVNKENAYNPENYDLDNRIEILLPITEEEKIDSDDIRYDENGNMFIATYIDKDTYNKFLELQATVKQKYGIDIEITEAGRTIEKQEHYYNSDINKTKDQGNISVAPPGHSEHHTGLAFDYSANNKVLRKLPRGIVKKVAYRLAKPGMFFFVNNEAAKLGLVLRYPKFQTKYTGYMHERWHLSDIKDPVLASYLRYRNMSLEKFYANASKYASDYERFENIYNSTHHEKSNDDEMER